DIDHISVAALAFHHHIAQIDANAELHAAVRRQLGVPDFQLALDGHGTLHGLDHTGKLRQQIIPRGVHDAPPVLLDERGHELPVGGDGTDGRYLVLAHEAAVSLHIRAEDRRKLPFHAHTLPELMVACLTDLKGSLTAERVVE